MIGFLKGRLVSKRPPTLTLDVGGVGYEIDAPMSTFYALPEIGSSLSLVTHLLVREDAHVLYGFTNESERMLFRNLLKVSGIGARTALGLLSGMTVDGFHRCIRDKDLVSLTRVPGIGKKTAERLLVEMADRLPPVDAQLQDGANDPGNPAGEAQGALLALGYKSAEVVRMLKPFEGEGLSTEDLIREALRRAHRA